MKTSRFFASVLLAGAIMAPGFALAADYDVPPMQRGAGAGRGYGLPYPLSFEHNYGPGAQPGTFVYYDGPSTNRCYQSAARYVGQDNRGHPCF
jgi:hypothetical protein